MTKGRGRQGEGGRRNIPSNDDVYKGGIDFLCVDVIPLLPTGRLQQR